MSNFILTEVEWNQFKLELKKIYSENIFDFLVLLYKQIDDKDFPYYMNMYFEKKEQEMQKDNLTFLYQEIDSFIHKKQRLVSFIRHFENIICKEYLRYYCFEILIYFDAVFEDKEKCLSLGGINTFSKLYLIGPLNIDQKEYKVYTLPSKTINDISNFVGNYNIRKPNLENSSNLFSNFFNYKILKSSELEVKVKHYNGISLVKQLKKNGIKIAVIPFFKEQWFEIKHIDYDRSNYHLFEILDKSDDLHLINESYEQILTKLDGDGVDIVIFPELSANEKTEDYICQFLSLEKINDRMKNLKLIFLGSCWKKNKNSCVLLSNSGTKLIENYKKSPFIIEDNGRKYKENLQQISNEYELLDVDGLGRILYIICKDSFEKKDQLVFWEDYNISFEFVSTYSKSLEYFKQEADRYVKNYLGIYLVANACQPRLEMNIEYPKDNNIPVLGFLAHPIMEQKVTTVESRKVDYSLYSTDCRKDCTYCKCYHIYSILPMKDLDSEKQRGMNIKLI